MMTPFELEMWIEFGIVQFILCLRLFTRWKIGGLKGFHLDDMFACILIITWIGGDTAVHFMLKYGSFVGLNKENVTALTDAEIHTLSSGSKALYAAWFTYVITVWAIKGSILSYYYTITRGVLKVKLVRCVAVASVLGFVAAILTIFTRCLPMQKNWQIRPYAGDNCTLAVPSYYIIAVLNVSTDIAILAIIIPLVWTLKIPLIRKLLVGLLMCSGFFVIASAIIRITFTLRNLGHIDTGAIWGIRELFIGTVAVNLPAIKPLFNKTTWGYPESVRTASSSVESQDQGGKNFDIKYEEYDCSLPEI